MFKELQLEDHGQDFTLFVVNEENVIVDCQPFQQDVWIGKKLAMPASVGDKPILMINDVPNQLNYAVTEITEPVDKYEFWKYPHDKAARTKTRGALMESK